MLKAYFDKSGDHTYKMQTFLHLSGVAAIDTEWAEIEQTWRHILQAGSLKAEYMHMIEAVHLRGEFNRAKGWSDNAVFELINALLSYVTTIPKDKYCQFICSVDMNAYRALQKQTYQMDSPVDLCNAACVEAVMWWYLTTYKGLDFEAVYCFDQGEPFEEAFKKKWERQIDRDMRVGNHGPWSQITHIGSAAMRKEPGLQIADMLAWSRNREETKPDKRFEHLALALTRLAPTVKIVWDEEKLRKTFRPYIYQI
jgi:Protein of unknown function (DUF3800)